MKVSTSIFVTVVCAVLGKLLLDELQKQQHEDFMHLPPPLRPHRPLWLVGLDKLLAGLGICNVKDGGIWGKKYHPSFMRCSLYADDLIEWVEFSSGLTDWGDPEKTFYEGFTVLGKSLENEAELTTVGRLLTWIQMKTILENRLRIVDYAKVYPEVDDEKIEAPIFIIGMPRSGTSFLHKLLHQDRALFRSPLIWEIQDPVPPTDDDEITWNAYFRILIMKIQLGVFKTLAPTVAAVHNVAAMNAEECMPILALDARSLLFNTLYNVPSYQTWLMSQKSQLSPLLFHKRYFQTLQHGVAPGKPPKTWLLKTPWHMFNLEDIWKVYPDARVIMPHRDPAGMVASLSSLNARFYSIVSDSLKIKEIAKYQKEQWPKVIAKFLDTRARNKDRSEGIVDLRFEELVQNPLKAVETIYTRLDLTLSEAALERMQAYLNGTAGDGSGKKGMHGKHEYELEWFGLNEDELIDKFETYCQTYNVPRKFMHSKEYHGKT